MIDSIKRAVFNKFIKYETIAHELSYLFWECTLRCNLNCIHCGSDCRSVSNQPDMPFEVFASALDSINKFEHKATTIAITGGEPLLREDLEFCGEQIRKKGFYWGIVTNGLLYNENRHKSLMDSGMGSLTLSLDGLKNSHNWLRNNENSYMSAMNAITLFAKEKELNSDIVTCVNKKNIYELNEIKSILIESGVKHWRLFTIAPIGRAVNFPELFLNSEEFTFLMDFIKSSRTNSEIEVKFSCEAYVGRYENQVRDGYFFCRAGINIASVLIDGSISACPNISRSFIQGNVKNDDFIETWNNKFEIFRDRKWMKTGICSSCKEFKHCLGSGMHLREPARENPLQCHYSQII